MLMKRKLLRSTVWLASIAAVLLSGPAAQANGNWEWELNKERYKRLNAFERAQYNKAKKLFEDKQYRAAAAEFEKFKIQFADSSVLPYVIFMRGYSLHKAKDRNRAIKTYNEVLDYFGDQIDDAAAALFHLGIAHFDNGDDRDGMAAMKEMADDEDYSRHSLAAGALRILADNHWKNKEPSQAVKYWKQVVRDFHDANKRESERARNNVIGCYIRDGDYKGLIDWIALDEKNKDVKHRVWVAKAIWDVAWLGFERHWSGKHNWDKYTDFNKKVKAKDMAAFWNFFHDQRPWFEKDKQLWDFYARGIRFLSQRMGDDAVLEKAINEADAFIKTVKKAEDADTMYSYLIDRLREGRKFSRARYLVNRISNRVLAAWKEYDILGHGEGKWKDAVKKLDQIEENGDEKEKMRAMESRAWVYKERLRMYDEAIEQYRKLSNPPKNLWGIQECYYRQGNMKNALTTLREIESSFPNDAPNAAWHRAYYHQKANQTKDAIAEARRILKHYPKSDASSKAHQLLEGYGIKTGGGLVDE